MQRKTANLVVCSQVGGNDGIKSELRLKAGGNETVTNCHAFIMKALDVRTGDSEQ